MDIGLSPVRKPVWLVSTIASPPNSSQRGLRGDGQLRVPPRGVSRNHLPVDLRSPQDLAPLKRLSLASGCPGVFGPVPQPVSMDVRSMAAVEWAVNCCTGRGVCRLGLRVAISSGASPNVCFRPKAAISLAFEFDQCRDRIGSGQALARRSLCYPFWLLRLIAERRCSRGSPCKSAVEVDDRGQAKPPGGGSNELLMEPPGSTKLHHAGRQTCRRVAGVSPLADAPIRPSGLDSEPAALVFQPCIFHGYCAN